MSEVVSFRLNKDNPRERQALVILETWCAQGYNARYILTEALIKLGEQITVKKMLILYYYLLLSLFRSLPIRE